MQTPETLLNTVYAAWSKCLPQPFGSAEYTPKNGETFCNDYVIEVAQKGFDELSLKGLEANEIFDWMKSQPVKFTSVSATVAQQHANAGALVIAAWKNPVAGQHGHVSVVIPGIPVPSEKWNDPCCPVLANVGELQYCKIGITANWAFGFEPTYFVLNSSLT